MFNAGFRSATSTSIHEIQDSSLCRAKARNDISLSLGCIGEESSRMDLQRCKRPPTRSFLLPKASFLLPKLGFLLPKRAFLLPKLQFLMPKPSFLLPKQSFLAPTASFLLPKASFLAPTRAFRLPKRPFLLPKRKVFERERGVSGLKGRKQGEIED
jgi:hypothetical protein